MSLIGDASGLRQYPYALSFNCEFYERKTRSWYFECFVSLEICSASFEWLVPLGVQFTLAGSLSNNRGFLPYAT